MKKALCLLLLLTVLVSSGCAAAPASAPEATPLTREFTDDCGRTVTIPVDITGIAVSGPLTQAYLYPLCPELFVGVCTAHAEDAKAYIPEDFLQLPEIGQLYGGKGTLDLENLLAADPDVVIDVGDRRDGMAEDLNRLTEQTGIPFVHLDATVQSAPQSYRKLGALTGKTEQAERLALWCEAMLAEITAMMERVDADHARRSILYCTGEKGLNVLAEGSFHAETLNLMGDNAAKLSEVVGSGAGNEVDLEQIILWDPDVILFEKEAAFAFAGQDEAWQQLSAISSGDYYQAPYGPYGWLASPPSVQRYLGMIWLGDLLYPDYVTYDLQEKVTEFYDLFYHHNLSAEGYAALTANALR